MPTTSRTCVAALTEDGHIGQLYEVTGPRLWTFAEAVQEIARATGREIQYREISAAQYAAGLEQAQLPPDLVALISYLCSVRCSMAATPR